MATEICEDWAIIKQSQLKNLSMEEQDILIELRDFRDRDYWGKNYF